MSSGASAHAADAPPLRMESFETHDTAHSPGARRACATPLRIAIADDHAVVRTGYRRLLELDARVATFLRLDNVLDHRYVGSVIVNESNGRYYEPAPDRTIFAGIKVTWKP